MKLLRSLLALTAIGIAAPVYANGPVTVYPEDIKGVGVVIDSNNHKRNTALTLNKAISELSGGTSNGVENCNVGNRLIVDVEDPMHDRAFVLFNTAMLTGKVLQLWVQCWTDYGPVAITVEMVAP